ncbi:MAG: hypothetical protein JWO93_1300 [Micrococcaceae bacterium]|jgi:hypothetical protein|nr:hypothetical protein [Micrococcaceae bacterium]
MNSQPLPTDEEALAQISTTAAGYASMSTIRFHIAVDEVRLVAGGRTDLLARAADGFLAQAAAPSRTPWTPLAAAICLRAQAPTPLPPGREGRCTLR